MRILLLPILTLMLACGNGDSRKLAMDANALYQEKKYDEAIDVYTKALKADPRNPEILMSRGLANSMKGDWKACVKDLDAALGIEPNNLELLNTRAFAYLHIGSFDLARKDFRSMDNIEERAGQKAQFMMAQNLLRRARSNGLTEKGDREKALADYNRVLELAPPNDMILYERASVLIDLKDYKAALNDMNKVIEIDGQISELGDTFNTRAEVLRALGDEESAKADEAEARKRSAHLRTNEANKTEQDNR